MNQPPDARSSVRAVVFDFYGTLAEAPDWGPSWGEVLAESGHDLPDDVRDRWWSDGLDGTEHDVEPAVWERYRYAYDPGTRNLSREIVAEFTQFPLRLAWAVTIHKSQGMKVDRTHVVVDQWCSTGEPGLYAIGDLVDQAFGAALHLCKLTVEFRSSLGDPTRVILCGELRLFDDERHAFQRQQSVLDRG